MRGTGVVRQESQGQVVMFEGLPKEVKETC